MENQLLFERLQISGWRQFRNVEIDFHDRLTILTGSNGSGKSTILKILKCHFSHEPDENFLATPVKEKGKTSFSFGRWLSENLSKLVRSTDTSPNNEIGTITFSNGIVSSLQLPEGSSMRYALQRTNNLHVAGISIGSHRPEPRYQEIKNISVSGIKPKDAYKDFFDVHKSYVEQIPYFKDGMHRQLNPVAALKEAIISFATFGVGNKHVAPIPELVGLYEKFQDILRKVLPQDLGFERLEIRTPEVVVVSSSGDFPIDGASGGLMSIIQLSWQVFLQSEMCGDLRYMILIDEPENHLHPSMQRTFLSNIVNAFPNARFVVVTHSPIIISSVKDSHVYALRHHSSDGTALRPLEPRSVDSHQLDQLRRAGPAAEILREVLGVSVTMPDWSASELEKISSKFAERRLDAESLKELRLQLAAAGLEEFFPQAIEWVMK